MNLTGLRHPGTWRPLGLDRDETERNGCGTWCPGLRGSSSCTSRSVRWSFGRRMSWYLAVLMIPRVSVEAIALPDGTEVVSSSSRGVGEVMAVAGLLEVA